MKNARNSRQVKRIILTIILIAAAIISFSSAHSLYDSSSDKGFLQTRLNEKLIQVGAVWATTKVVSGVISVLQTIQIEVTPFGFGAALNPLGWTSAIATVLDQLSIACMWAMGALMVEKILLSISFWAAFKLIIPLCVLLAVISLWLDPLRGRIRRILLHFSIITCTVCFAIPLSLAVSGLIEQSLLSNAVEKKLEAIHSGSNEAGLMLEEDSGKSITAEKGFSVIDTVKRITSSIGMFLSEKKGLFDAYITDAVNYLMYFLVASILLPIATIFGLWRLARYGLSLAEKR